MKFYSILEGQTQDVLRRLLRLINKSNAKIGTVEGELEDIVDLIGDPDNPGAGTILKRIGTTESDLEDVNTLIGDPDNPGAGTILARIAALEQATPAGSEPGTGEGG